MVNLLKNEEQFIVESRIKRKFRCELVKYAGSQINISARLLVTGIKYTIDQSRSRPGQSAMFPWQYFAEMTITRKMLYFIMLL